MKVICPECKGTTYFKVSTNDFHNTNEFTCLNTQCNHKWYMDDYEIEESEKKEQQAKRILWQGKLKECYNQELMDHNGIMQAEPISIINFLEELLNELYGKIEDK